jgi:hypothetical protein
MAAAPSNSAGALLPLELDPAELEPELEPELKPTTAGVDGALDGAEAAVGAT